MSLEDKVSNLGDFAFRYFHDFPSEFLLALLAVVESTFVVLRQSVGVTEYETALALDPQQPHLLVAVETSLPVGLFLLHWLESQLFHRFLHFAFSGTKGGGWAARKGVELFFLFDMLIGPEWEARYLKQEEQRPAKASEA